MLAQNCFQENTKNLSTFILERNVAFSRIFSVNNTLPSYLLTSDRQPKKMKVPWILLGASLPVGSGLIF